MRHALELVVFPGVAILFHVALFARVPADGVDAGGIGGEATISLEAADATVAEMVAAWDRPVMRPSEPAPVLPPVETGTETLDLPRLDLAEAPRAQMRMAALPPAEAETLRLEVETALPRPQMTQPEIVRPAPPSTPATPDLPLGEKPAPDPPARITALGQPQAETLEIETEAAEAPPSAVAPTASLRPPRRPAPRSEAEQQPEPRQESARKAEQTDPGRARQRAAGAGGSARAGTAGSAAIATLSKGQQAKLQQEWGARILARIERAKRYPRGAHASGQVQIVLSVARTGQLLGVSTRRSSGNAQLDQAALDAVRRAGRFTAAPRDLPGNSFAFSFTMVLRR